MTSIKSWLSAARLRTLPLSISGIITGSSIAYANGYFNFEIFFIALLVTIGFQIISNFANDYGDGVKGTDNSDRIGPERAIQSGAISPKLMIKGIKICGGITFVLAIYLIYISFGLDNLLYSGIFFVLGIASIYAAVKYTVGKNAYGYSGYGDLFVLLFFGIVSVCGSYFLYAHQLPVTVLLPGLSIGLLSVGVLNLNNMRDRESDKKSGKRTLVVKIGDEFAKYYHYYLLISAFLTSLLYANINYNSIYSFLFILAFIPIGKNLFTVYNNSDPEELDPELKKLALSTFLFSILFAVGQIL